MSFTFITAFPSYEFTFADTLVSDASSRPIKLAGDGVLTIDIGIVQPIPQSNLQFPVRAVEVEKVTAQGPHLSVVAVDIDATG